MADTCNPLISKFKVKTNFHPEYYNLDRNDTNTLLGQGAFAQVNKAKAHENSLAKIREHALPEEVAVKITTWKNDGSNYKGTEWDMIEKGFSFDSDNIIRMFFLEQ